MTSTEDLEPIGEAELAQLRADFAGIEAEGPPDSSVDPEQIWAAVHGELSPEECVVIIDRLHRDPALALEWRLALELRDGTASETAATPAAKAPANDRRYWYTGALALMAAALVLLIVLPRDETPDGDPTEIGDTDGTLREAQSDAAIRSELEVDALPAAAFELRWTPIPGALRYELQVTTRALDPVYAAPDLDDNKATVPHSALESLPAGTELVWRVTAVMPDGQRRSSTAMSVALQ